MRVITASNYGGPEVLRVEERPAPQPQADEALVEVKASGVNLMDIYARRGMLKTFSPPLSLGVDGAGVVIAAGDRSTARVGDRVAWEGVPGSYAELVVAPSARLIPIPEGVSFEAAAGGLMQGMTAQHLCYEAVPVATDAVVLVHSAGSGVGRMLTQLATRRGARVIATVSTSHKSRPASDAGAWRVLVRDEIDDLGAAIWELTNGEGVDIAFDGTGKTLFNVSVSVLHFNGVFATYGFAGGRIPPIDLGQQPSGVHFVRYSSSAPTESTDQRRQRAVQVMRWIEDKTLDVLVDRTYPLQDAASAHRDLESQQTVGKLLLIP
jgi:NADPH2:quinone reductase